MASAEVVLVLEHSQSPSPRLRWWSWPKGHHLRHVAGGDLLFLAGIYVLLWAHTVAVLQVLVYAGR